MSLVGTLAKVAIGVAAAKGIAHVISRVGQQASGNVTAQNGGVGSIFEQLNKGSSAGTSTATSSSPSLDDLIRGLPGATSAPTQGTIGGRAAEGSFADVLNQSFQKRGEPETLPTQQQNAVAGLMLRAMLQAAKCDGSIDEGEQERLRKALGNASREDMAFVNRELSSPVDVQALARQVPKGLENQVYAASLMGMTLDSPKEAEYLRSLASALGMGLRQANDIHVKLGAPTLLG